MQLTTDFSQAHVLRLTAVKIDATIDRPTRICIGLNTERHFAGMALMPLESPSDERQDLNALHFAPLVPVVAFEDKSASRGQR